MMKRWIVCFWLSQISQGIRTIIRFGRFVIPTWCWILLSHSQMSSLWTCLPATTSVPISVIASPIEARYGAILGGPLCRTHNLTLRLFSRTCLHMMSDEWQHQKIAQNAQITWQTISPWWWGCSPLQRRGFDEFMPPKEWAAFHIFFPMPLLKQFNTFNKLMKKSIYFVDLCVLLKSGSPAGKNGGRNVIHCCRQQSITYE